MKFGVGGVFFSVVFIVGGLWSDLYHGADEFSNLIGRRDVMDLIIKVALIITRQHSNNTNSSLIFNKYSKCVYRRRLQSHNDSTVLTAASRWKSTVFLQAFTIQCSGGSSVPLTAQKQKGKMFSQVEHTESPAYLWEYLLRMVASFLSDGLFSMCWSCRATGARSSAL